MHSLFALVLDEAVIHDDRHLPAQSLDHGILIDPDSSPVTTPCKSYSCRIRWRTGSGTTLEASAEGSAPSARQSRWPDLLGPMSPKLLASASSRFCSVTRPMALASPMANAGRPHSSASIATRPAPITRSQPAIRAGNIVHITDEVDLVLKTRKTRRHLGAADDAHPTGFQIQHLVQQPVAELPLGPLSRPMMAITGLSLSGIGTGWNLSVSMPLRSTCTMAGPPPRLSMIWLAISSHTATAR